jgi:pyruvate decarboxylase
MIWVGTCNELNGAYAADGYARAKGVPGALVTTYGVGEMSAVNGVAGAYSEHVPIIHIVGTTSRLAQKNRAMIHHTIQEDHTIFQQAAKVVSTGSAFLTDEATFTEEVDRVIEVCVKTRHPVYLFVPADTPDILVDAARLAKPLDLQITNPDQQNVEDEIVDRIITEIKSASRPCVLVDGLTHRYGLVDELKEIIRQTGLPVSYLRNQNT